MARTPQDVTDAELALLQVLWDSGPATIRHLTEVLYRGGGTRSTPPYRNCSNAWKPRGTFAGNAHHRPTFSAAIARGSRIGLRLQDMAEKLCGGSLTPLLTHLVRSEGLTARERQELRSSSTSWIPGARAKRDRNRRGAAVDDLLSIAVSNAVAATVLALAAIVVGTVIAGRR